MNGRLKIILHTLGWAALAAVLIASAGHCRRRRAALVCSGVEITVSDSLSLGFITSRSIRELLARNDLHLAGTPVERIDAGRIEGLIAADPHVSRVRVYHTLDGRLHIEAAQRTPILRVQSANGYRFYLSADGWVMPTGRPAGVDVPIVTGNPAFPFGTEFAGKVTNPEANEKNSTKNVFFYRNLINFVEFLQKDSFWNDQFVQIDVSWGNEVNLIPRVGAGVIRLGTLEGFEAKLDKLLRFYRRGLAYEGWDRYRTIDLRFRDQVVCTPWS